MAAAPRARTFPKEVRLRKRKDYVRVQESGTRTGSSFFLLLAAPRDSFRRVGITVSSKVGNAVVRNRIKRWVREFARARLSELPEGDLVVIAKQSAAGATHAELDRDLDTLFRRARRSA